MPARIGMQVNASASPPMPTPSSADHSHGSVAGAISRPRTPVTFGAITRASVCFLCAHNGTSHIIGRPIAMHRARHAPAAPVDRPADRRMSGSQPITRNVTVDTSPK
ncbi:hypothetical protein GCM10029964_030120 [Kibdelosporangium lantanae]